MTFIRLSIRLDSKNFSIASFLKIYVCFLILGYSTTISSANSLADNFLITFLPVKFVIASNSIF